MGDKIKKVKCKKCKAKWIPRVSAPRKCPNCQTREWDEVPVFRPSLTPAYRTKKKGK